MAQAGGEKCWGWKWDRISLWGKGRKHEMGGELERRCGARQSLGSQCDLGLSVREDEPCISDKEKSRQERHKQSSQALKRVASAEEVQPRIKIKKEKEDPAYERYASGSQQCRRGSERKAGSRVPRDEEERRHQRPSEGKGEKSCQNQRGQSGLWDEREKREEAGRRGDRHGSRREECPEGGRSRERSSGEPHPRHGERGSARASSRC